MVFDKILFIVQCHKSNLFLKVFMGHKTQMPIQLFTKVNKWESKLINYIRKYKLYRETQILRSHKILVSEKISTAYLYSADIKLFITQSL